MKDTACSIYGLCALKPDECPAVFNDSTKPSTKPAVKKPYTVRAGQCHRDLDCELDEYCLGGKPSRSELLGKPGVCTKFSGQGQSCGGKGGRECSEELTCVFKGHHGTEGVCQSTDGTIEPQRAISGLESADILIPATRVVSTPFALGYVAGVGGSPLPAGLARAPATTGYALGATIGYAPAATIGYAPAATIGYTSGATTGYATTGYAKPAPVGLPYLYRGSWRF